MIFLKPFIIKFGSEQNLIYEISLYHNKMILNLNLISNTKYDLRFKYNFKFYSFSCQILMLSCMDSLRSIFELLQCYSGFFAKKIYVSNKYLRRKTKIKLNFLQRGGDALFNLQPRLFTEFVLYTSHTDTQFIFVVYTSHTQTHSLYM